MLLEGDELPMFHAPVDGIVLHDTVLRGWNDGDVRNMWIKQPSDDGEGRRHRGCHIPNLLKQGNVHDIAAEARGIMNVDMIDAAKIFIGQMGGSIHGEVPAFGMSADRQAMESREKRYRPDPAHTPGSVRQTAYVL